MASLPKVDVQAWSRGQWYKASAAACLDWTVFRCGDSCRGWSFTVCLTCFDSSYYSTPSTGLACFDKLCLRVCGAACLSTRISEETHMHASPNWTQWWHSTAAMCIGQYPFCSLRIASCPRQRWVPQLDKSFMYDTHTHTHTQSFYCSSGICPGLPGWAGTRKVKPILIYWSKR